jgi:hypothetical protein
MIVELQRWWVPSGAEEGAREEMCALCAKELEDLSVVAFATTDEGAHIGELCASCVSCFERALTRLSTPRCPEPPAPPMKKRQTCLPER